VKHYLHYSMYISFSEYQKWPRPAGLSAIWALFADQTRSDDGVTSHFDRISFAISSILKLRHSFDSLSLSFVTWPAHRPRRCRGSCPPGMMSRKLRKARPDMAGLASLVVRRPGIHWACPRPSLLNKKCKCSICSYSHVHRSFPMFIF
jgi:hypothetical protein